MNVLWSKYFYKNDFSVNWQKLFSVQKRSYHVLVIIGYNMKSIKLLYWQIEFYFYYSVRSYIIIINITIVKSPCPKILD